MSESNVSALPAPPETEDTEILRLYRRHRDLFAAAAAEGRVRMSAETLDRLYYHEADAIRDRLKDMPSTCAADFAAKLIVAAVGGHEMLDWDHGAIWREARALTGEAA